MQADIVQLDLKHTPSRLNVAPHLTALGRPSTPGSPGTWQSAHTWTRHPGPAPCPAQSAPADLAAPGLHPAGRDARAGPACLATTRDHRPYQCGGHANLRGQPAFACVCRVRTCRAHKGAAVASGGCEAAAAAQQVAGNGALADLALLVVDVVCRAAGRRAGQGLASMVTWHP